MSQSIQTFGEFERAAWDNPALADKYHEHLSALTRQSIGALLDAAKVGSSSRVLDVATGAGYVAEEAARRGADPIGIDFSGARVEMARRTYPHVRFEQADVQALPYNEDTFEAVVNAFGMCHLPEPDVALREAQGRWLDGFHGVGRARARGRLRSGLRGHPSPWFVGRGTTCRAQLLFV